MAKVFFVGGRARAASTVGQRVVVELAAEAAPAPARSRHTPLLAEDPRVASAQAGVVDPTSPVPVAHLPAAPAVGLVVVIESPFAIRGFVIVPVSWLLRLATPAGGVSGQVDYDPAQPARCRLVLAADPDRHGAGGVVDRTAGLTVARASRGC
jgi:hypothetical protein